MKKFLLSLFAIAIGMVSISCSSDKDDDEKEGPSSQVVLNVNTASIMNFNRLGDFLSYMELEAPTGSIVPSGYRMRVRNLTYDKRGVLVSDEYTLHNSIFNNVSQNLSLPKGNYTVITIADVVGVNSKGDIDLRFWNVCDSTNLYTVKIKSTDYVSIRKIIGGAVTEIKADGKNQTYTINTPPLGSLIFTYFANIHSNSSIYSVSLATKKKAENLSFKNNKFDTYSTKSGGYIWRYRGIEIDDYSYSAKNVYGWSFALASDETEVGFLCIDRDYESWAICETTKNITTSELIIAYCDLSTIYKIEKRGYIVTADEFLSVSNNVSKYRTLQQKSASAFKNDMKKAVSIKNGNDKKSLTYMDIAKITKR